MTPLKYEEQMTAEIAAFVRAEHDAARAALTSHLETAKRAILLVRNAPEHNEAGAVVANGALEQVLRVARYHIECARNSAQFFPNPPTEILASLGFNHRYELN